MGNRPACAVVLGKRALVEQETAVGENGRDGVLDLGIDAGGQIAGRVALADAGGKLESRRLELEPQRWAVADQKASALEVADQPVLVQLAQRRRRRVARRVEGARDAGLAKHEARGEAFSADMVAEHVVDEIVERQLRRRDGSHLIAPAVRPRESERCARKNTASTGRSEMRSPEASSGTGVVFWPCSAASPTGKVRF